MALDLTLADAPIFASKNWLNSDSPDFGLFTTNSLPAILERIFDGDPFSQWGSATNTDGEEITIEFSLQDLQLLINRNVDIIALQNINWKNFKVEFKKNADAYAIVPGLDHRVSVGVDGDNTEPDIILNPSTLDVDHFRISITHTFDVDDFKLMGGFVAGESVVQLSNGLSKIQREFREDVQENKLGNGDIDREYTRRSAASYEHWGAKCEAQFVTEAQMDSVRGIKRDGDAFVFIPEPGSRKQDVFLCHFKGRWRDSYEGQNKGAGKKWPFVVQEVGSG